MITKPTVFVSYSSDNKEWVRRFSHLLKNSGFAVTSDEIVLPSDEIWMETLEEALQSSQSFVIVLSPKNETQPTSFFELGAAIATGKRVIAAIPDTIDSSLMPSLTRLQKFVVQGTPEEVVAVLLSEALPDNLEKA